MCVYVTVIVYHSHGMRIDDDDDDDFQRIYTHTSTEREISKFFDIVKLFHDVKKIDKVSKKKRGK